MDYAKVIELVKKAGSFVFDKDLKKDVQMKGASDFVTAVDLKISEFLKKELALLTPEIGFMSEEEKGEIAPTRWILDPIDGTTNLVFNYNMSTVSLALFDKTQVVFGVIYNPFNGDTFTAERGKGAYLNGERLQKAADRDLKDCLIEFGAGSTKKQYAEQNFTLAKEIFKNCLDIRRVCSSALVLAYIAAGKINGYFERVLKPWDYAAATLLLDETGVKCTDWQGKPLQFETASSIVCGTDKAYELMYTKIQEHLF